MNVTEDWMWKIDMKRLHWRPQWMTGNIFLSKSRIARGIAQIALANAFKELVTVTNVVRWQTCEHLVDQSTHRIPIYNSPMPFLVQNLWLQGCGGTQWPKWFLPSRNLPSEKGFPATTPSNAKSGPTNWGSALHPLLIPIIELFVCQRPFNSNTCCKQTCHKTRVVANTSTRCKNKCRKHIVATTSNTCHEHM